MPFAYHANFSSQAEESFNSLRKRIESCLGETNVHEHMEIEIIEKKYSGCIYNIRIDNYLKQELEEKMNFLIQNLLESYPRQDINAIIDAYDIQIEYTPWDYVFIETYTESVRCTPPNARYTFYYNRRFIQDIKIVRKIKEILQTQKK